MLNSSYSEYDLAGLWFDEFSLSEDDSTPERDEEEKLTELAPSLLVLTARDRLSPADLEASAEVFRRGPCTRVVGGTTVPEPDDSSVRGIVTRVEDREWKVDCSPLDLVPDEKNASSDTEAADSERTGRARERPALGGGVTIISRRSVGPLDTVTGEPSPMTAPASPSPKPNPGRASLARRKADSNSSPRSVIDVVRRSELLRLGAIIRGSPG